MSIQYAMMKSLLQGQDNGNRPLLKPNERKEDTIRPSEPMCAVKDLHYLNFKLSTLNSEI